jgi:2'-deoxynucleoside 5'-phosphate N-hydrolase
MLKVYFTASTSHNGELISYYKKLLDHIKKHSVEILSGDQVVNKKVLSQDKQLTSLEIYSREKMMIDQSDIVIAEVSKPSLGVGSEIVYALSANKPVLAMVRTDFEDKISPILLGNPSENLFLEYYRNQ